MGRRLRTKIWVQQYCRYGSKKSTRMGSGAADTVTGTAGHDRSRPIGQVFDFGSLLGGVD